MAKLVPWGRLAGAACLGSLAALGPMALLACAPGEQLPTYRYRLAVTVAAPEGLRRGSSVVEVRTTKLVGEDVLPDARGYRTRVIGEAAVVDLGRRGLLVALLRAPYNRAWASGVMQTAVPPVEGDGVWNERALAGILASRGARPVPRDGGYVRRITNNYPILLRVSGPRVADIGVADPDNLDAAFGRGVRLVAITVERTDAPVTRVIAAYLPWLKRPEEVIFPDLLANPVINELGLDPPAFMRDD